MDLLAWDLGDPSGSLSTNVMRVSGSQQVVPGGISSTLCSIHERPMTSRHCAGCLILIHCTGARPHELSPLQRRVSLAARRPDPERGGHGGLSRLYQHRCLPTNQTRTSTAPCPRLWAAAIRARPQCLRGPNYGQLGFIQLNCNVCHGLPKGTEGGLRPAGFAGTTGLQGAGIWRNIYQKLRFNKLPARRALLGFGLVHEGSDANVAAFLRHPSSVRS